MTPLLVVLDMAGTTVRDEGAPVVRCLREALAAEGSPVPFASAIALMGIPKPLAIRQLREEVGASVDAVTIAQIHADFVARMLHYYRNDASVGPIDGAEATFARLRAAGIRVALDTGFSRDIADAVIERLNWQDKIDASITSDEVENGRPHPDMIYALMNRFDIADPARVAKVGDTPSDLQEGTAANCGWVIGVTEGTHTIEQLTPYPHTHLIPSVAALPALFDL